jgi:hypothetical protein
MNHKPLPLLRDGLLSGDRDGCDNEPCPQRRAVHQHDEKHSERWSEVRYSRSNSLDNSLSVLFEEGLRVGLEVQDTTVDANMR